jgi:serine/threonine-protein kinase
MAQLLELQEAAQLTSMSSIAADIDPAVENAIRQCLDPDPLRRPHSALAVSAALPGGDALAAALAAGETPSPEMVAQSGRTEGLERRYSIPCVLLIAACMIAAALLRDRSYALLQTPVDMPPEVLAQKSRDVAEQFGYTRKPGDSDIRVDHRAVLIRYLNQKPAPRKWDEWLGSEAPVMSLYRESLGNLDAHPFGRVTPDNPAPIRPGMVFVNLEGRGNLREFFAAPYASNAAPVTTEAIFQAIGFDLAKFTPAPVDFIPRYAADRSEFWKGPHPVVPDTEMRVELAWWQGRPTHVRVAYPFMGNEDPAQRQQRMWIWKLRGSLLLFASLIGTLFVVLLARRNWKLGRTDRRGALRLATFKFLLGMLVWLGSVHPVQSDTMIFFLLNGAADWLMVSAMVWVMYLALEPAVRSHWPHALVTWNRVLTGRWADAQVGAHVLIGATVGACVWVVASVVQVWVEPEHLLPGGTLFPTMGARQWVAEHANTLLEALNLALVGFFCIFGLRRILRKDVLAALVAALIFAFSQRQVLQSPDWVLHLVSFVAISAILIFILLRLGLVATLAAMFYIDSFDALTVGVDWKTWFAPYGMATLVLLIGIALFAFNRSLGSRELLGSSEQRT